MENYVGSVCPFCRMEIRQGDLIIVCPACGEVHHKECWEENQGCTTFGCSEQFFVAQRTTGAMSQPEPIIAMNGGTPSVQEPQSEPVPAEVQPKPEPVETQPEPEAAGEVLPEPAEELPEAEPAEQTQAEAVEEVLPESAEELSEPEAAAAETQPETVPAEEKTKKKKWITGLIIAGAAAVIILLIILFTTIFGAKHFDTLYENFTEKEWCTMAEDGRWMLLDTNPYDMDDYLDEEAWDSIKSVLTDLDFPISVAESMSQTTSSMGEQTASAGRYQVSWTYHRGTGLEVLFKSKF